MRRDLLDKGRRYKPLSIIGLNDFHGQLDPSTQPLDNLNVGVGGAPQLATMFDEESSFLPGRTLLLAAGDNVGASPPNSALLDDRPAIDVENAWGLDATSFGNHEFDFGVERILEAPGAGQLPVPVDEHRRGGHRPRAGLDGDLEGVPRERRARRRDRLHGPHDARARACRRDRGARSSSTKPSASSASRRGSAGAA